MKSVKSLSLAALVAVLAVPGLARAQQFGIRAGLETPLYTHVSNGGQNYSFSIGDSFQPSIDLLLEYYPVSLIGIGIEAREGFLATGTNTKISNCAALKCDYQRTGTAVGPNVTLDFAPIPLFARASLPIHLEPDPVTINFRAAGGLKIGIPAIAFYVEAAVEFPVAGSGVSAFSTQQVSIGAGVWLKF